MATLEGNLTRIRRFLRDTAGTVWSDDTILRYWNDAQLEVCQLAKILERVEANYFPPEYDYSFQWDWERQHLEGDMHQALTVYQQTGDVITHPWESGYWLTTNDNPDDGYRFTHPWEGAQTDSPADVIPMRMHTRYQRMKYFAYDEEPLQSAQIRDIAANDPHWKTRSGQPTHYVFSDETENLYFLYPRPSNVTWQETEEGDVFDDDGGLHYDFGWLYESDTGLTTDAIDTDNAVFTVYDAIPYEMTAWDSEDCDIPEVLRKYVEYATLERCFGADTDAFIPTLRDYWQMRKNAGIEAIKRMMRMRTKDRDYQFGGSRPTVRVRGGSLGAHYPSV